MNWEAIGAIGEVVAATMVVLTLIYLAVQTRQSVRATHAATMHAIGGAFTDINLALLSDDKLLTTVAGFDEPQSREDKAKYHIVMLSMYRIRETMFIQSQSGTADPRTWERLKPQIRSNLKNEYARRWWRSTSDSFLQDFAAYVDSEVEEIEKVSPHS